MIPGKISIPSEKVLQARYFDDEVKTPDDLWRRVSGGNNEYYDLMRNLYFMPNSPTLFNAGTKTGGTLSACFVFDIADSLNGDWPAGGNKDTDPNSIIGTLFKASCVAKAGGGVGYYFGNIREKGATVHSVHRRACGPVQVVRFMHQLRSLITQGGKRDLAQMGVLPCWHKDAVDFIHCKDEDPKSLESFNLSVSWLDSWIDKVQFERIADKHWVHRSGDGPINKETMLWVEQCSSAWKTGCPGMLFFDRINEKHPTPHVGAINATNPCGETPNTNNEPCNLGSAAIVRFLEKRNGKWRLDMKTLLDYTRAFIRFLDDILDWNVFPHPDITAAAMATRKLGLGVMGWADLLALMHIPYDCQDAVAFGKDIMNQINSVALNESMELAVKKGIYPAWMEFEPKMGKPNPWPKARNSTRTSIAPTGTIAIIADVWGSIEPHYALECTRTTNEGIKLEDGVPEWVKKELDGYRDFTPKTAKEIDWRWHIKHQAAFQAHTDLGVSKTINMPQSATLRDISDAYRMMWDSGCKGGTIFREGCREEAVLVDKKKSVYTIEQKQRLDLPDEFDSRRKKFSIGGHKGYIHAGVVDGRVVEVFIRMTNPGSTVEGMMNQFCVNFSKALQGGEPLENLIRLNKNHRYEPHGMTGDGEIPVCTSIPDFVVRWLELRFLKPGNPGEPAQTKPANGEECEPVSVVPATQPMFGTPRLAPVLNAMALLKPSIPGGDPEFRFTADDVVKAKADAEAYLLGRKAYLTAMTRGEPSGTSCPNCGAPCLVSANCVYCPNADCGWNRCG